VNSPRVKQRTTAAGVDKQAKILRRVELHAVGLLQPLTYPVISEEPVLHRIRLIHPTGLRLPFPGTDHHYPPTRLSHGEPRIGSLR
jgi:hypothetical protein